MTELTFEDWIKLELKVAEVKSVKPLIVLSVDNKDLIFNKKLKVKVGDKILVGFYKNGFVVPVVNGDVPILPDKGAEPGMRIG